MTTGETHTVAIVEDHAEAQRAMPELIDGLKAATRGERYISPSVGGLDTAA